MKKSTKTSTILLSFIILLSFSQTNQCKGFRYAIPKNLRQVVQVSRNPKLFNRQAAYSYSTTKFPKNALHLTAQYQRLNQWIPWLIDGRQISVDSKGGKSEETAFLIAAQHDNLLGLQTLHYHGANMNVTDKFGNNALHLAALFFGKEEVIKWLIDMTSISINSENNHQRNPFLCTAQGGNLAAMKILTSLGADIDATDEFGNTALHLAALFSSNKEMIKWIINNTSIDIESRNEAQRTPLHCAAQADNVASFETLLSLGAEKYARDQNGNTAAHLVVESSQNEYMMKLADYHDSSFLLNNFRRNPFLFAAEKGNLMAIQFFLRFHNVIRLRHETKLLIDQYGNTPLHLAAMFAPQGIHLLVRFFFTESRNNDTRTPFLCAAQVGNLKALKSLKWGCANVEATDKDGNNALHLTAMLSGGGTCIHWLLKYIYIESGNDMGRSPFLCAAQGGNLPALKILASLGAYVGTTDHDGRGALHIAALYTSNREVIKWLIRVAERDVESKSWKERKTPFLCAAQGGNLTAMKILASLGANIHATDKFGNSALHTTALYLSDREIIEWLLGISDIAIESRNKDGKTPFLCAAQGGNLSALKDFKEIGANLQATDQYGNNALHTAILFSSNSKVVEWLINIAEISIESENNAGQTAFLCAAASDNLVALNLLKEKGAKLDVTDKKGNNALHTAASYISNGEVVKWLINNAKISLESKNNVGETPFVCAANNLNVEVLKVFTGQPTIVEATAAEKKRIYSRPLLSDE